ncbi:MAG: potassium-transporting ATPase subunit KdpC [Actinobacteria bacterium]|nr:potassium-transporting ATPase subunit KdpC [Actinomycetota bacterium]
MRIARRALMATLVLTFITGVFYPLMVTVVGQLAFGDQAEGSLIREDGTVVGSRLIGQAWQGEQWMYGRPSAIDYDAGRSGASNLGPASEVLTDAIGERAQAILALENAYRPGISTKDIPPDLLLASGSGLDPDVSVEAARFQARRLASVRGIPLADVLDLIEDHARRPPLDLFGAARVNVMELNRALESKNR